MRLTIPLPPTFFDYPGEPKVRWANWLAQLDNFFTLTNLTLPDTNQLSDRAKNAYLSSLLGNEGSRILMAHPVAATASTAPFDDFSREVESLFERPVNPVRAEYEFRNRRQSPTESVSDFLTALRTLYVDCDSLGDDGKASKRIEDHNLAMQLAIGCHSRRTQEKLLQETEVDLDSFLKIMLADESATESSAALRNESVPNRSVAAVSRKPSYHPRPRDTREQQRNNGPSTANGELRDRCYGCGKQGHRFKTSECPAFGKSCNYCKKANHFSSECLQKKKGSRPASVKVLRCARVEDSTSPPSCAISLLVTCDSDSAQTRFMVDSGADVSTIHRSDAETIFPRAAVHKTDASLLNYDGTAISELSHYIEARVSHQGRSHTTRLYLVPENLPAVAGRDLIHALALVIDGKTLSVRTLTSDADQLLAQHPALTSDDLGTFPGYEHRIQVTPDFKPHVSKLRPIPLSKRDTVAREIQHMVDTGVWSPIDKSESAHAMVLVAKKDGGIRITSDLSPLNQYVVPHRHPLPLMEDLLLQLRGMTHFSKLDLRKGYFHLVLDEESRRLTATLTPLGLFAYNRLPMGLKDAASAFQKCVSDALSTCKNTIAFLDDILVFGRNRQEHDDALKSVLTALDLHQLRLNTAKCEFGASEITFLGFRVGLNGIRPNPDKVSPIKNAPRPTNLKQVQAFLGAVNYLSIFIPTLADIAEPLRSLTRKDQPFVWHESQETAFQALKEAISDKLSLAIFDPNAPTFVTVDASDIGLGAQLSQLQDGHEVPIQFASHTLCDRERNFATNEREALACLWAIERWEKFLLGRPFTLRTDHGALLTLLQRHSPTRKSAKFARWLERLSPFDYNVEHIKGSDNCIADALSRLPQESDDQSEAINDYAHSPLRATIASLTSGPISVESIRQHTESDPLLSKVIEFTQSAWPAKKKLDSAFLPFFHVREDLSVENGCLTRAEHQFVIPASMQKTIICAAHEGHPGIVRMKRQLRLTYWWPGQATQAEQFVKYCLPCQDSAKAHKPTAIPPHAVQVPPTPWHKIGIDICGPFANAPRNQRFITVAIDYHSGFPEVLLSDEITSTRLIQWLTETFARFGNPAIVVTDNGRQFISHEFETFLRERDILHWRSAVYNPQQNGKVEAFNRFLKHGTQTFDAAKKNFREGIQELLYAYRATSPTPDGQSPAELLLGRRIRTNFEPARRTSEEQGSIQPSTAEISQNDHQHGPARYRGPYQVNDLVRTRLPHVPKGSSPFSPPKRVVEVLGNYTYRLSDGQVWNARRLARHREEPTSIAMEPDSGRPPRRRATHLQPRRSNRRSRGCPPIRYPHGSSRRGMMV